MILYRTRAYALLGLGLMCACLGLASCTSFTRGRNLNENTSADGMLTMTRMLAVQKTAGGKVIRTAMTRIANETILKGSCYDFVDAVYNDAGFTESKRKRVFLTKQSGPYADPALINAGDWIYYDHMYAMRADHSVIFVAWLDFENHVALAMDYAGGDRSEPGRYRVVDLFKIWGITRGKFS